MGPASCPDPAYPIQGFKELLAAVSGANHDQRLCYQTQLELAKSEVFETFIHVVALFFLLRVTVDDGTHKFKTCSMCRVRGDKRTITYSVEWEKGRRPENNVKEAGLRGSFMLMMLLLFSARRRSSEART